MADNDIADFLDEIDKASPFLKFEDGEPVVCKFLGGKIIDDTFNKGKKTMEYSVVVDGVEKTFKSGSANLARQLKAIEPETEIQLVKTGTSYDTRWYVKNLDEK